MVPPAVPPPQVLVFRQAFQCLTFVEPYSDVVVEKFSRNAPFVAAGTQVLRVKGVNGNVMRSPRKQTTLRDIVLEISLSTHLTSR